MHTRQQSREPGDRVPHGMEKQPVDNPHRYNVVKGSANITIVLKTDFDRQTVATAFGMFSLSGCSTPQQPVNLSLHHPDSF